MSRGDDERVADILEAAAEHRIDLDQVWEIATVAVPDLVERLRAR